MAYILLQPAISSTSTDISEQYVGHQCIYCFLWYLPQVCCTLYKLLSCNTSLYLYCHGNFNILHHVTISHSIVGFGCSRLLRLLQRKSCFLCAENAQMSAFFRSSYLNETASKSKALDMTKEQLRILATGGHVRLQPIQVNIPLKIVNFAV